MQGPRDAAVRWQARASRLRRADVLALGALGAAGCVPGWPGAGTASDAASAPPVVTGGAADFDRPVALASGGASLRFEPARPAAETGAAAAPAAWTIGNRRFEERLELRPLPGGGYTLVRRWLRSLERSVSAEIAEDAAVPESEWPQDAVGIGVGGGRPVLQPLHQRLERQADGTLAGVIRFRHAGSGAEVTAELRLRPGHAVVEHRASLHHTGDRPLRLTRLDAADLLVSSGPQARWRAATLDNQGNIALARLGRDGVLETETPAQSAARAPVIPLLVLHDATADEGLFFGLRWSTNYRITARYLGERRVGVEAGVRMAAAAELDPPAAVDAAPGFDVAPGQTVTGPWLILGLFDGGLGDGANALRAYLTDDRPRAPTWARSVLPVAWNSWFAYGPGPDAAAMRAEAALAPRFGVEVFYVDYGWEAALGDWTPHPRRFPGDALRVLADAVHDRGMRFGLWVAFGVAAPDSRLRRLHPDFLARQPAPARTGIDGSLPLCLARARPWLEAELPRIVRDYRLDWLKFDQPMIAACLDPSHGHDPSVRGSLQANTQAFYDVLRGLRDRFPELFVESTFDGAGYLDYGVYARSHAAWLDDAAGDPTVPMQTVQQSFYGASLAFPARFLSLWLARGPVGDGAPGRGTSPEDLAYQGYSTMGGGWGLSLRLADLDGPQAATVRRLVEEYRTFREVLPGARLYHLEPPLSVPPGATTGPVVDDWLALQYLQPEAGRGAILAVRNGGDRERLPVRLRGLAPDRPYRVAWTGGRTLVEDLGAALARTGVTLELPPYSGGLLWVNPTA
jgi:alpha-galactosidase